MKRFKKGQFVAYPDGMKGRIIERTVTCITIYLTDGSTAYLHPWDAEFTLTILEKHADRRADI